MSSILLQTASTDFGKIEYFQDGDSGPLIAGFHGSPGSIDQILTIMDKMGLTSSLCRRIVINRAGYCGTPLGKYQSLASQADMFAKLLEQLNIEVIDVILAFSGGGIMALDFARRHPQKVKKLLLIAPVTDYHPSYSNSLKTRLAFTILGMNTLVALSYVFPNTVLKNTIAVMSKYTSKMLRYEYKQIKASLDDYDFLMKILRQNYPFKRLHKGFTNENIEFLNADINNYSDLKLPILLLHGDQDGDVDISYSQKLCALVPSASLITIKNAKHLLMVGERYKEVQQKVFDFCEIPSPK